jgi:hypothetical protein
MPDNFERFKSDLDSPVTGGEAVTPSDVTDLTKTSRCLWVARGGNISVIMKDGMTLTWEDVPGGSHVFARVSRVRATGTTATGILALW